MHYSPFNWPGLSVLAICLLLVSCTGPSPEATSPTSAIPAAPERAEAPGNPLEGGWYLVHGKYGNEIRTGAEPFQFKLFGGDQFSFLMQSPAGEWNYASTGRYELVGEDIYRETFEYSTEAQFRGVTADWKYRLSNDTLYMEGPVRIVDAAGKEAPELAGGYNTMWEARVKR